MEIQKLQFYFKLKLLGLVLAARNPYIGRKCTVKLIATFAQHSHIESWL